MRRSSSRSDITTHPRGESAEALVQAVLDPFHFALLCGRRPVLDPQYASEDRRAALARQPDLEELPLQLVELGAYPRPRLRVEHLGFGYDLGRVGRPSS